MRAINYSEARQHLKTVMDTVCVDHEPTIITRKSGENGANVTFFVMR